MNDIRKIFIVNEYNSEKEEWQIGTIVMFTENGSPIVEKFDDKKHLSIINNLIEKSGNTVINNGFAELRKSGFLSVISSTDKKAMTILNHAILNDQIRYSLKNKENKKQKSEVLPPPIGESEKKLTKKVEPSATGEKNEARIESRVIPNTVPSTSRTTEEKIDSKPESIVVPDMVPSTSRMTEEKTDSKPESIVVPGMVPSTSKTTEEKTGSKVESKVMPTTVPSVEKIIDEVPDAASTKGLAELPKDEKIEDVRHRRSDRHKKSDKRGGIFDDGSLGIDDDEDYYEKNSKPKNVKIVKNDKPVETVGKILEDDDKVEVRNVKTGNETVRVKVRKRLKRILAWGAAIVASIGAFAGINSLLKRKQNSTNNFGVQHVQTTTPPPIVPTTPPTATPTATPTVTPTATPTVAPTATPIVAPTATPTVTPTATPTATPTVTPTANPMVLLNSTVNDFFNRYQVANETRAFINQENVMNFLLQYKNQGQLNEVLSALCAGYEDNSLAFMKGNFKLDADGANYLRAYTDQFLCAKVVVNNYTPEQMLNVFGDSSVTYEHILDGFKEYCVRLSVYGTTATKAPAFKYLTDDSNANRVLNGLFDKLSVVNENRKYGTLNSDHTDAFIAAVEDVFLYGNQNLQLTEGAKTVAAAIVEAYTMMQANIDNGEALFLHKDYGNAKAGDNLLNPHETYLDGTLIEEQRNSILNVVYRLYADEALTNNNCITERQIILSNLAQMRILADNTNEYVPYQTTVDGVDKLLGVYGLKNDIVPLVNTRIDRARNYKNYEITSGVRYTPLIIETSSKNFNNNNSSDNVTELPPTTTTVEVEEEDLTPAEEQSIVEQLQAAQKAEQERLEQEVKDYTDKATDIVEEVAAGNITTNEEAEEAAREAGIDNPASDIVDQVNAALAEAEATREQNDAEIEQHEEESIEEWQKKQEEADAAVDDINDFIKQSEGYSEADVVDSNTATDSETQEIPEEPTVSEAPETPADSDTPQIPDEQSNSEVLSPDIDYSGDPNQDIGEETYSGDLSEILGLLQELDAQQMLDESSMTPTEEGYTLTK